MHNPSYIEKNAPPSYAEATGAVLPDYNQTGAAQPGNPPYPTSTISPPYPLENSALPSFPTPTHTYNASNTFQSYPSNTPYSPAYITTTCGIVQPAPCTSTVIPVIRQRPTPSCCNKKIIVTIVIAIILFYILRLLLLLQ